MSFRRVRFAARGEGGEEILGGDLGEVFDGIDGEVERGGEGACSRERDSRTSSRAPVSASIEVTP